MERPLDIDGDGEREGDLTPAAPRSARAADRPFRAALVVVLALLAAEAGARLLLFGPDALAHPLRYVDRFLNESEMLDLHGGLLRLRPNLDVWYKGAHFTTNGYGLRGPSISKVKPGGVVRIAVMGRSNTMGHGVDDPYVWTRKLEERLNARHQGRFEVLNFAVSGQHLPAMLDTYERWASTFAPDVVMIEAYSVDFRPVRGWRLPKERPPAITMESLLEHSWLRTLLVQYRRSLQLGSWGPKVMAEQRKPRAPGRAVGLVGNEPSPELEVMQASPPPDGPYVLLDRFIERRRAEHVATVLVSLTPTKTFARLLPDATSRAARAVWRARHNGSFWFSTDDWVLPRATLTNRVHVGDPHPDPFAHSLYAESIYMQLLPVLEEYDHFPKPRQKEI